MSEPNNLAVESNSDWLPVLDQLKDRISFICESIVANSPLSSRDLCTVLLLHLPRFGITELMQETVISSEAQRLFDLMIRERENYFDWANRSKISEFRKEEVQFAICSNETAQTIYEKFHYIGACREGIAHLALFHTENPQIPMALMTLSKMDIEHLHYLFEGRSGTALVVSRSYAFDWAPRNSISFLTARVREWVRTFASSTKLLFTYVNPNLGFKGTSYNASGWRTFGWKNTRYRYFHDNYVTYRDMVRLSPHEKKEITSSKIKLAPLNLLATSIEGGREDIVDFSIR